MVKEKGKAERENNAIRISNLDGHNNAIRCFCHFGDKNAIRFLCRIKTEDEIRCCRSYLSSLALSLRGWNRADEKKVFPSEHEDRYTIIDREGRKVNISTSTYKDEREPRWQ